VTFDDIDTPATAPKPAAGSAPAATPTPNALRPKAATSATAAAAATPARAGRPNSRTYVLGGGASELHTTPSAIPGLGVSAAAAPHTPGGPNGRPAVPPGLQANSEYDVFGCCARSMPPVGPHVALVRGRMCAFTCAHTLQGGGHIFVRIRAQALAVGVSGHRRQARTSACAWVRPPSQMVPGVHCGMAGHSHGLVGLRFCGHWLRMLNMW